MKRREWEYLSFSKRMKSREERTVMKFFVHWNLFFFRNTSIAAITASHQRTQEPPEQGRNLHFRISRSDVVCVFVQPI